MNVVFTVIISVGILVLTVRSPQSVLSVLISGGEKGLQFSLKLFAIYAVWLSVLTIWQKLRFDFFLADKMKFLLRKLFKKENDECYSAICLNLSANMLGMGNAGTPAGIKAIGCMQERKNKIMLLVINSTSIQLLPTTLLALRAGYGATSDILLPSLLSTVLTTVIGILLVHIFVR